MKKGEGLAGAPVALTQSLCFSSILDGGALETVDLSCSSISPSGIAALIEAWIAAASSDLSLSLSHCPLVTPDSLLALLSTKNIYFKNGKLVRRGHCLSLFL